MLVDALRRACAWAMLFGVLAYSVADGSPDFLVLILAGLGVAWWVAVVPSKPVPPRAVNAGLLGVLLVGALQVLRLGFTVNAFAYFIAMLLIVKLLDIRRARDWGQALVLVTSLYISAVLTSNSMPTGLMLLIGSVLLFRAILRYQLYASAERGGRTDALAGEDLRRNLRSLQVAGGFGIMLAATVVFLFLPRNLGTEAFGNWGTVAMGQTTGFTDEVQLGGPGLISQSQTPVMDLTVLDRNERNIGRADSPPIYLRGALLDVYDNGRWTSSASGPGQRGFVRPQFIPDGTTFRPLPAELRNTWHIELRVTVRNATPGSTPLFAPWIPIEFRPVSAGQFISHDPATGMVMREGAGGRLEYFVRSHDPKFTTIEDSPDVARSPPPSDEIPAAIREYAQAVLAEADILADPVARPLKDDIRALRALENHLQSTFAYTLQDEPVPAGREPTVWFLTERRRGHCEYYASALALMARSIGINARVLTGYVASDFNEVTGQYVVRESNAHGWVEAEVAPETWMVFDGTPRSDFFQIHQPGPSFWRSVKKLYETVEFAWATGVVSFNTDSQRRLFGDTATDFGLRRFGPRVFERLQAGGSGLVLRALGAGVTVFLASLVAGLLLLHRREVLLRLWSAVVSGLRRWKEALTPRRRAWPEVLHDRVLLALDRVGKSKPPGTPLRAHLADAPGLPEPLAKTLNEACDLLYRSRFARNPAASEEDFRRAVRSIRSSENS